MVHIKRILEKAHCLPKTTLEQWFEGHFVIRKCCKYYSSIARGKALARKPGYQKIARWYIEVRSNYQITSHNSQCGIESPNEKTIDRLFRFPRYVNRNQIGKHAYFRQIDFSIRLFHRQHAICCLSLMQICRQDEPAPQFQIYSFLRDAFLHFFLFLYKNKKVYILHILKSHIPKASKMKIFIFLCLKI